MSGGRVELREGVVFADHGGRELTCDVFLPPAEARRPAPGVLFAHGGAWQVGDPSQLRGYGFLVGREGYVCVIPQYRLTGEAAWPAQIHDVKAALRWMRTHADEFGLDPTRIAASGNSSGGHLALMLAGTAGHPTLDGDPSGDRVNVSGTVSDASTDTTVQAAIAFYGPSRLEPGGDMLKPSVEALMGPEATPERYAEASPVTHVSADFPPAMLLHSNLDDLVPPQQSIDLYTTLRGLDVPCELHMFDGSPHAFDGDPALGRLAATMVVSFLRRFLPDPDEASVSPTS